MYCSPSDAEQQTIRDLAQAQGRSEGDVLLDGFRRGLRSLLDDHERQRFFLERQANDVEAQLRSLLLRMAAGEEIDPIELVTISHDADIPTETLEKIRLCLNGEKKNGSIPAQS